MAPTRPLQKTLNYLALRVSVAALLFSFGFATTMAGTPAGYAEYIIPFDEDVFAYVTDPVTQGTIGANDTSFTLISVTAWSDTVTVYVDHWENGYGYDADNPHGAGTDEEYTINANQTLNFNSLTVPRPRTSGDGNTYIGSPAGDCTAQPTPDLQPLGTPATASIRLTPNYCYDGRDRIITVGGATTVTRGGYFNNALGKLAAIGEEVFPLAPQLTKYILPFGEDVARNDFQRVFAIVQATEDNTIIQLDFDGDGRYDWFNTEDGYRTARVDLLEGPTKTLQRGEQYVIDRDSDGVANIAQSTVDPGNPYVGQATLNKGTVVLSNKTIQVMYFYGQNNSFYNTRATAAFPNGFWGKDYYLSADGGTAINTDALIYNPNTSAITIDWALDSGPGGSFSVPANTTTFFQAASGVYIPDGSGLYLHGSGTFWGTSDVDTNGVNWDWGYSMLPDYLASDDQTVAWAPGNSPVQACNTANARGNGIFVTPLIDNTIIFIDTRGDGTPDTDASIEVLKGSTALTPTSGGYKANRLESLYITGSNSGTLATSDCDLTGARVYATGPFVMSYGENPDRATVAGGLDLGYTVLPSPENWMDLVLTVDKATSPALVSTTPQGTAVTYTLVVNTHEFPLNTVSVVDTLPTDWEFVPGFTTITYPDLTTGSTDPTLSGAGNRTLTWPTSLFPTGMLPNQKITITFRARTTASSTFVDGDVTQNKVLAIGTRDVGGVTQTFKASDFVFNYFKDITAVTMEMTKASSVAETTPVSPGDTLTYTVTITNPATSTANLTGVTLLDPMPVGVTYVAASGEVTCELAPAVADNFNTNSSYAGNDGSLNWNANWTETSDNNNPASGTIQVVSNQARFVGNGTAGRSINRVANVTGQTSATISFNLTDLGIGTGESLVAEYSIDGGGFVTIGTLDGGSGYSGSNPLTVPLSGNTTLNLRFRAPTGWNNANDSASVDNVRIALDAGGRSVRDGFGAVAYTNNGPGNTNNWATNWAETDGLGGGAASGLAQVTGGALRLSQVGWNVRDEFASVAYTNNGPNNTNNWATNWTETDSYGTFANGAGGGGGAAGGYVSVTGGALQLGYLLSNARDEISTSNVFTGDNGSNAWATNWDEDNDDDNANGGDIQLDTNSIRWNQNTDGGEGIKRSVDVTNATSITISETWTDAGVDGGEGITLQYGTAINGPWTDLRTFDGGSTGSGGYTDTIAWDGVTNPTFWVRYVASGNYDNGDNAYIDDVDVAFNVPSSAVGAAAQRTVDLTGRSAPILSFDATAANLEAGDTLVVEVNGGSGFTTLATYTAGTPDVAGPYDLTPYISGATVIRFRVTGGYSEAGEAMSVDNVDISDASATLTAVLRTADLTGALNPSLSFTPTAANLEAGDTLVVEASTSAGGSYTTLATYTAGTPDVAGPYNLTPYISATTAIRFRITGGYSVNGESFSVDDVAIAWSVATTPNAPSVFVSADPPSMLKAAAGCMVRPNSSMTVTFDVTVDDPFPTGRSDILNIATSGANEIPVPLTDNARNIVVVPGAGTGTVGDRVWFDADRDGVFDPGENGLSGVQLTLKDQYGTPLKVTTTDSLGRYLFLDVAPGTGYYVEITGGLPAGLTQTTDTVGDPFNTNGVFNGSNGTLDWLTNWSENGDDGVATTGDIRIAGNRIEFRDTVGTVAANESIQRSVTVTGATSVDIQYDWSGTGLGANDRIQVQYSIDGTNWTTIRTIDNDAAQTFTDTVAWTPTNNTFFLRYQTQDALETGDLATIDNVQVSFPQANRTAQFDIAAGQNYIQADLGFRASDTTAVIGDFVWSDADGDQIQDPGEPGLAGITVELYAADVNGLPTGAALQTAVTSSTGVYLFSGISANGANDYVVTINAGQTALSGYTATTGTLSYYPDLASGAVRMDADFGFQNPSSTFAIKDGIWLDNGTGVGGAANDGIKNGSEVGIAGVTVDLYNASGVIVATTTTAADGTFAWSGIPGGQNYRWKITDVFGVLNDYFGTTTNALSGEFQLAGNLTTNLDYTSPSDVRHFGYNVTRSIGDTVFNDNGAGGGTLNNGVQDGTEPGISGVTVLLYRDVDDDGVFEPGADDGAAYATQVTDSLGHYLFAGLPNGSRWFVSIDGAQPTLTGYARTTADVSGVAGDQLYVTPILTGSANRLDMDFGYRATTPHSISGRFFNDVNRNGADNAEAGFQSVTVELVDSNNTVIATTSTAADGSYSFTGLPNGATYSVRVTDSSSILAAYETTYERTEGGLSSPYDALEVVALSGADVTNVDFGYYKLAVLVTRATVTSFLARDMGGRVALEWETTSEMGTVGFFVKRWDASEQRFVPVNDRMLPSILTPHGGVYRYIDPAANVGQNHRYELIEVEAWGHRNQKGPYDVNTAVTAQMDVATMRVQSIEPDPRPTGFAMAARVGRSHPGADKTRRLPSGGRRQRQSAAGAKLSITESGAYYISLKDLATRAGLSGNVASLHSNRSTFALTNRGSQVPFTTSNDGSGIVFYGQSLDSPYAGENVYWLGASAGARRMKERRDLPRGTPGGSKTFARSLHLEQNDTPAPGLARDPESDYWYWDFAYSGDGPKAFAFRAEGVARTGVASLVVRLKGGSDTEANPDHHVVFRLNGEPIGDTRWDGLSDVEPSFDFDASLLVDGENNFEMEAMTDTEAPYSLIYLDSFDVRYESLYRAYGNRAKVSSASHSSILISGFNRSDVMVFDVSDAEAPVRVTGAPVAGPDGTYGVALSPKSPNTIYYAVASDALMTAGRIEKDVASNLRSRLNRAAYVIITNDEMADTAQTLADYRADLTSMVVDIEDVYDEFNSGIPSPLALRSFLAYARSEWRQGPEYVLLAGDGTWDYKDALGLGRGVIPPMMIATPSGIFPSDTWFANVDPSTAAPEMAIGRLPVSTPAELALMITKIAAREAGLGPWLDRVIMATDDPDDGGDFPAGSREIAASLPPGSEVASINIAEVGGDAARVALIDGINSGVGTISYIGHGGYWVLADEGLLWSGDEEYLVNADQAPVMTAMTCLAGNFGLPWVPSIGEMLVRREGGGLAALWAPTGESENEFAVPLAEGFYRSARIRGPHTRIGDAIQASMKAYGESAAPDFMLGIYTLLGDPAMRLSPRTPGAR